MKFKFALWIILFVLSSSPANPQDTLVLNTAVGAPLHASDGTGFLDSVVKQVMGRIGIQVTVRSPPAERALINANAGIDDGDLLRIAGLEKFYPNLVRVREPIYRIKFTAFAKSVDFQTTSWNSFAPYSVGIITGWKIYERNITDAAHITMVKDAPQLFDLLVNDRAQVVFYTSWMGLAHLKNIKISGVKMLQPPLAEKDMFIYLHKKHSDLIPKIAASLRAVKADGTYQRLYDWKMEPFENN